eukprot:jgi/Psemu1/183754/e_gw1.34.36.1
MVKISPAVFLLGSQLQFGTVSAFLPASNNLDPANRKATAAVPTTSTSTSTSTTALGFNWFGLGKKKQGGGGDETDNNSGIFGQGSSITITNTQQKDYVSDDWLSNNLPSFGKKGQGGGGADDDDESADVVIIGGGVAGLAAAITAAEAANKKGETKNIVLVEANTDCGGRVNSVTTDDGFVLDEGFAVFIEEYPAVKKLLDYDALELKRFLPGALVKIKGTDKLARVADPLRNPEDIFESVLSPIGSLVDKIKVLPLVLNVRLSSVNAIFEEPETDTKTALVERWGFSDEFINSFLKPFLEGIYLAPLPEQSSRMFSFVFKMFSDGSATLPKGGMVAVSNQLVKKAESLGVKILTETPVTRVSSSSSSSSRDNNNNNNKYVVECTAAGGKQSFETSSVVGSGIRIHQERTQRAVGCLYYGFEGPAPVEDPILVLNGMIDENDDPVNNVCFPSVVNEGYAPEGYNLCSVTILSDAMNRYMDKPDELDQAVRRQLGTWFVDQQSDIMDKWDLKQIFYVSIAQPSQFNGPQPASFNGGRSSTSFYGKELPSGFYVCGDHMATATLNGAVESGVQAGTDVAKAMLVDSA